VPFIFGNVRPAHLISYFQAGVADRSEALVLADSLVSTPNSGGKNEHVSLVTSPRG